MLRNVLAGSGEHDLLLKRNLVADLPGTIWSEALLIALAPFDLHDVGLAACGLSGVFAVTHVRGGIRQMEARD